MEPRDGFQVSEGISFNRSDDGRRFDHSQTGQKRVLFDAVKDGQHVSPKWVLPVEEQGLKESRRCARISGVSTSTHTSQRLWKDLTLAISNKDMEAATDAKSAVEDAQREQRKKMEENAQKHVPQFFVLRDGRWEPKFTYVAPSFNFYCS